MLALECKPFELCVLSGTGSFQNQSHANSAMSSFITNHIWQSALIGSHYSACLVKTEISNIYLLSNIQHNATLELQKVFSLARTTTVRLILLLCLK